MTPIRIQRKRTKGFRLQAQSPDGAPVVSVARPGKWGNPFVCKGDKIFINAPYRRNKLDPLVFVCMGTNADAARLFELTCEGATNTIAREYGVSHAVMIDIHYHMERLRALHWNELKGKHIACFCAVGEPCHGDYILKRANQEIVKCNSCNYIHKKSERRTVICIESGYTRTGRETTSCPRCKNFYYKDVLNA